MLCKRLLLEGVEPQEKRRLSILGSTGSIGKSALDICRRYPEKLEVVALTGGKNASLLQEQILEFRPPLAVLAEGAFAADFSAPAGTKLAYGEAALIEAASLPEADTVLAAILGVACLEPVLGAIQCGKKVALANKESVVCGGAILENALLANPAASLIPVDSEHSSLFQCLHGHRWEEVAGVVLTASGGPFLHTPGEAMAAITPEQAVRHPRWNMGAKISVDSATMMNKALELIEAHWLFGIPRIDVLVHPQSIIHGMVTLVDGTVLAHLGMPDMKAPIAHALFYPEHRLTDVISALDLAGAGALEFLALDEDKFPAVRIARECLREGGAATAVFNIANEIAVRNFLDGRISFPGIMQMNISLLEQYASRRVDGIEDLRSLITEMEEQEG